MVWKSVWEAPLRCGSMARSFPNRFPHHVSIGEEALSVPGFPFRYAVNCFGSREHGPRARTNRSRAPRYFGDSAAIRPDATGAGNDGATDAGPLQQGNREPDEH